MSVAIGPTNNPTHSPLWNPTESRYGAAAFHPTDLFTTEVGFLIIVGESDMYQNSDGTGAVADTDPVGRIDDLANSNNMLQSTASYRVTYNESGSTKYITGDGTSDHLLATHALGECLWWEKGAGGYLLVAHRMGTHTTNKFLVSFGRHDASSPYFGFNTDATTKELAKVTSLFGLQATTANNHFSTSWGVSSVAIAADDDLTFRINGGSEETFAKSGTVQQFNQAGLFALGRSTTSHWLSGDIAAVFVRRGAPPSAAEQAQLETYFGNLVGLSI